MDSCLTLPLIIITIKQRLKRHVLVIRMTNRRREGHVDLRVAVSVIKRFEFLFKSVTFNVTAVTFKLPVINQSINQSGIA